MSKLIPGTNDIFTKKPELVLEWDYDKNAPLTPNNVAAFSNKKYWWKCGSGHSWLATPNNRSNGYGCPYCSGRLAISGETDIASQYPALIHEWDYDKNDTVQPNEVTCKSNKKYWWRCDKGHSWQEAPQYRTRGDGCPYCSGHKVWQGYNDLATLNPRLAKEWNYEKNDGLTPKDVTVSSSKKVWWKCLRGHEWLISVAHRNIKGLGCPYCSGRYAIKGETDLATINPLLAKEWDYEKNGDLSPDRVTPNSEKKIWWKCPICNHEWQATPANRNSGGTGCPNCYKRNKTSFPEQAIFYYVKKEFPDAINSYTDIFNNGMELDVYIPSLKTGIEYDGYLHKGKKADLTKYQICHNNDIKLIRVSEIERDSIKSLCDRFIKSKYLRTTDGELDDSIIELLNYLDVKTIDVSVKRDRFTIYNQYLTRLRDNSLLARFPLIAAEWHPTKNFDLKPEMFNWGAGEKVWWKCSTCGHEWQASIASRTSSGVGCVICGRKKTKEGQIDAHLKGGNNSLVIVNPELAKEWDYEKNKEIDINRITPHSNEKVWWRCSKGHSWQAVVNSRSAGNGCPYCANIKVAEGENDFASHRPELAKAWNYEKNGELRPNQVAVHSNKKVWWKCEKGHEWQASVSSISSGRWCPFCSGKRVLPGFNDLQFLRPDLMREWAFDKNQDISPDNVTEHSGKKAWWRCSEGHEWYSVIDSRSKGHGCPICARQKRKH